MSHPLDTMEWPLWTGRLLLRRATPDDVDATWAFRLARSGMRVAGQAG